MEDQLQNVYGIFFELAPMESWGRTVGLQIFFTCSSLATKQIVYLCKGDRDCCYLGSKVFVSDMSLNIEGYRKGNNEHSEDIIYGIPDIFGSEGPVQSRMVMVSRKHNKGAGLTIFYKDVPSLRTNNVIGKLRFLKADTIQNLVKEYLIVKCGVIYEIS